MSECFSQKFQSVSYSCRRRVLTAAISANLLANVSLSGLNVALPAMEKALNLSAVVMVWVSSSLLLATAASIAPAARLADLWGRRQCTILGLIIVIAASAACGLATGPAALLIGRGLMGLGLALVMAATMAMAAAVYPPDRRGMVFGYIVSAVYIGLAAGPGLCGVLVEFTGWPGVFWLTSLTLLLPLALLLSVGPEADGDAAGARSVGWSSFDYVGAGLWMAALSLIFIGLTNILSRQGLLLSLAGFLAGLLFARRQLWVARPLMDVRLFSESRRFRWSSLAAFAAYCSAMGAIFLMGLYLQYVKGFTPREAGFFLMVQPLVQALLTPVAGRLSDSRDPGRIAAAGLAITTMAVLMIALGLSADSGLAYILTSLIIFGIGFASFAAPNSNAVMSSVGASRLGVASGIITATRLSGQISSLSFTALVFGLIMGPGRIEAEMIPDFIRATRLCFMVFAPMCFLGAIASLVRDHATAASEPRMNAFLTEAAEARDL